MSLVNLKLSSKKRFHYAGQTVYDDNEQIIRYLKREKLSYNFIKMIKFLHFKLMTLSASCLILYTMEEHSCLSLEFS